MGEIEVQYPLAITSFLCQMKQLDSYCLFIFKHNLAVADADNSAELLKLGLSKVPLWWINWNWLEGIIMPLLLFHCPTVSSQVHRFPDLLQRVFFLPESWPARSRSNLYSTNSLLQVSHCSLSLFWVVTFLSRGGRKCIVTFSKLN